MTNQSNATSSVDEGPKTDKKLELDQSTALAVARTRLAAERTLMSWIRMSFSMITFGFTILKFFQYLNEMQRITLPNQMTGSKHLGIFLILLGIASLIPGMVEHRRALDTLSKLDGGPRWSYTFVVGVLVGFIGIYALIHAVVIRRF